MKSRVKRQPILFAFNLFLGAIVSSQINRGKIIFTKDLVLSVLSMIMVALSVYLYNDLTDVEIDALNKLNRPLVTGEASKKHARNLIILFAIIGLTAVLMVNSMVFLLMLTYFVLYFLYSLPVVRLKNIFLLNKITVGVGSALAYLIGGAVFGEIPPAVFLMAIYGFLATIATSAVLDFRDVKGDKMYEVKSLPLVWGPTLTIRFIVALTVLVGLAMTMGYIQLGFHIAFTILTTGAFAVWIFVLYPLFRNWDNSDYVTRLVWRRLAPLGLLLQILTVLATTIY